MRIELTTSAWKADVLPLNYTRMLFWLAVDIPTTNLYCVSSPRSRSKLGRCSNFNHFSVFAIRGVENDNLPVFWLEQKDSNLQYTESKSAALPFGYAPVLAEKEGFEPPEDLRLQRFSRPPH